MKRVALMVLLSIPATLAVDKDKGRFAPGPASSYPGHQTQEQITVAAIPYNTDALATTAFGNKKPHEYGVLPVLVVIQNDTGRPLRLEPVAQFVTRDGQHVDATPPEDIVRLEAIRRRPDQPNPNPLGVPVPWKIGTKKGPLDTPEIEGRAFAVRLIPPGESAHGFFYFRAADLRGSRLYLKGLMDAATGKEYFYFELPLDAR
jgi:hypothetical protein